MSQQFFYVLHHYKTFFIYLSIYNVNTKELNGPIRNKMRLDCMNVVSEDTLAKEEIYRMRIP